MGTINDIKSKLPPPGKFLTQDERDAVYVQKKPFFVKRIDERQSNYTDEKTGAKKEQWVLTCVFAEGGDEWQLSLTKNFVRDPLVIEINKLLATDEFKLRGIGPLRLGKYKAGNGNLAYTIEDWEDPGTPAPVVANGAVSAKCPACGETASGVPIQMGDDRFVPHDCKKDRKKILLPVPK
jgi:hypothetical protein